MTEQRDLFGARVGEYEVPDNAQLQTCRSCGADMLWAQTPNGNSVPLSVASIETRDGKRYALSHFVDCPNAKEWRRR